MAAKLCNVVFYQPGSGSGSYHAYILFASTLPDRESIVGTIGPLTDDTPRPEHPSRLMDTNSVDEALTALEEIVEGLDDHYNWSKLSDCP